VVAYFKVISHNLLGGTKKTTKYQGQYSRYPDRDSNPGPKEYKTVLLTIRPRQSISLIKKNPVRSCDARFRLVHREREREQLPRIIN
jgi:hypothetical protein